MPTNHDDDSWSEEDLALATDLAYAAELIVYASMPQVEDDPPGLSFEERLARVQDFRLSQQYQDGQIDIYIGPACDGAGHEMREVAVLSCNEHDETCDIGMTVFLPDDDEVAPIVDYFRPGLWCTHVLTVAQRAQRVLADRQED